MINQMAEAMQSFVKESEIYVSLEDVSNYIYGGSKTPITNAHDANLDIDGEFININDMVKIPYFYTPYSKNRDAAYIQFIEEGGFTELKKQFRIKHSDEIDFETKDKLKRLIASRNGQITKLKNKLAEYTSKVEELEATNENTADKKDGLSSKVEELTFTISELEAEKNELEIELETVTSNNNKLNVRISELNEQLETQKNDIENKGNKNQELEVKIKKLEDVNEKLSKQQSIINDEKVGLNKMGRWVEDTFNRRTIVPTMVLFLSLVMIFFTAPTFMAELNFNTNSYLGVILSWLAAFAFETATLVFMFTKGGWAVVKKLVILLSQGVLLAYHTNLIYYLDGTKPYTGSDIAIAILITFLFPTLIFLFANDRRLRKSN